jgi:TatA/E family protein of Tat protein translocase
MPVLLFLDVSGGELLVILLFVLLFFGSKGVPEVARTMGRALRQFRDATAEVQREIEKGAGEVKKGYQEQRQAFRIEPPVHVATQRTGEGQLAQGQEPAVPASPDSQGQQSDKAPDTAQGAQPEQR